MKLTAIALSCLVALVAAQESTSVSSASSTTTEAPASTTSLSAEASCAAKCGTTDICCTAACYHVPCPSDSQANDTITCVAACPQGNGTEKETEAYASCQNNCYSSHFFAATTLPVSITTGSSEATTTGSSTKASGSSASDSASETGSSSATSSGSETTETPNAATVNQIKLGASAAGLLGLVAAALAL
ncbi:hypothetical protein ASPWEDRAFT_25578 [Aspergillus wentii DTO 134E9]|uniref:Extracellular membrane protein CFEM domain-containing protein n=1 Tax=Aspergillus wentii DTO 134E9 TaxID=1073089 RepID=A0A1L9RXV5_ASPWE|nr:uncharacterized protein ASPWEDRAFT_25578 [Aspergillus wentii DTO 134E9]KAI9931551.1 hypothetical protein MW887_010128 [Aspergillus wentii]OJJ39780.1 hypothetical protein ASPWEDRAFT_25578 [Aspergillus wentii DTO 134E9]